MLAACHDEGSNLERRRLDSGHGTIKSVTRLSPWSGQGVLHACRLN